MPQSTPTKPTTSLNNEDELVFTIWEHIEVFRKLLLRSIVFFLLAVAVVHYFRHEVITILLKPLGLDAHELQFLSPLDPLYFLLKIDLVGGFILSIPVVVTQFWLFVAPAVSIRRSIVLLFFLIMLVLSSGGILYAYYVVTPIILSFMNSLIIPGTVVSLTAQGYLNFIITTTLILLAIFQLPIIIFTVHALELVQLSTLTSKRRIIFIGILVGTAIITPTTDIITLFLVAIPAILAYELGIIFIKVVHKFSTLKKQ